MVSGICWGSWDMSPWHKGTAVWLNQLQGKTCNNTADIKDAANLKRLEKLWVVSWKMKTCLTRGGAGVPGGCFGEKGGQGKGKEASENVVEQDVMMAQCDGHPGNMRGAEQEQSPLWAHPLMSWPYYCLEAFSDLMIKSKVISIWLCHSIRVFLILTFNLVNSKLPTTPKNFPS